MLDKLREIATHLTGLAEVQIALRQPLEHQSNRLYDLRVDGRHWIAKEFLKPDELEDSPRREFEALKLLSALDIAPQPVYFQPNSPPIVIYEYVEGQMWDRYTPTPAELVQLAELWLTMHQATRADLWLSRGYERPLSEAYARFQNYFENYRAWAQDNFAAGLAVVPLCFDLLEQRQKVVAELETLQPVMCFCRSDPRFANVISRPDGRLAMIDWEDSGLRDPARDLADLICHANQEDLLTDEQWQPFLNTYLAERSIIDPMIAQRLHLYRAIFPLFWLALLVNWGVHRDQHSGWQVNGLPANERLRRYLARSLAWPDGNFELAEVKEMQFFPA